MNNHNVDNEDLQKYVEENLSNYEVSFEKPYFRDGDIIRISFLKDGVKKSIYFNYDLARPVSNSVDGTYFATLPFGNAFTLHSYYVDGFVRSFVGITNLDNGAILRLGYDINKEYFYEFPKTEDGLIDDGEVVEMIKNEKCHYGIPLEKYQEAISKNNIFIILRKYNIYDGVCDKLREYNTEEIGDLSVQTNLRLQEKFGRRRK